MSTVKHPDGLSAQLFDLKSQIYVDSLCSLVTQGLKALSCGKVQICSWRIQINEKKQQIGTGNENFAQHPTGIIYWIYYFTVSDFSSSEHMWLLSLNSTGFFFFLNYRFTCVLVLFGLSRTKLKEV